MMNTVKGFSALAALGLVLAGCSKDSSVVLTPQPPNSGATTYTQIERLSRPVIKEVFETFQQHQISNAVEPYADPTIKQMIHDTENAIRPPKPSANPPTDFGTALQTVLYPDEYTVNLAGGPPTGATLNQYFLSYELTNGAAFGGRAPNDDVIDLELAGLFGNALTGVKAVPGFGEDNEENNCLSAQNIPGSLNPAKQTTATFPYLPNPS